MAKKIWIFLEKKIHSPFQVSKCLKMAVMYVMIDCQSGRSEEVSSSISSEVGMPTDSAALKATWKFVRTSLDVNE